MDLSRTRVVLRERAVIDIFDLGLRFVVTHASVYAKVAALVLPPFAIASIFVARAGGWLAAWSFAIVTAAFAAAPFTVLASRLVFEDDVRIRPAIGAALRAMPRLIGLRVVTLVVAAGGFMLLVIPGVWFLALTAFAAEVLVLERPTIRAALSRSMGLVGREPGQALTMLLVLPILELLIVIAADVGGGTLISALFEAHAPSPMWNEGWSILSLLGFWLFVPYVATARFLVYLDVRTRSEGWDIQTRFTALAARAPQTTRSAA